MTKTRTGNGWRRGVAGCALALVVGLVAGCGRPQGHLSGRVLLNGTPLPGGWVIFRHSDPRVNLQMAQISEEGTYEVTLPAGEVSVGVDNRELQPPERSAAPPQIPGLVLPPELKNKLASGKREAPPAETVRNPTEPEKPVGKFVPIPKRYYDVETSGLHYTVEGGNQQQDIELKK